MSSVKTKIPYNSKGFAYIFDENDYKNQIIKGKLDNNLLQVAHSKLRAGTLIKLINPKTNDSIILKNNKRFKYPDFFKIVITNPVAQKINLKTDLPLIELIEIKKNKSFIAKKSKIYNEEKKIFSNAPVAQVKISNISKNKKSVSALNKENIYIIVAEFYSNEAAVLLKNRITEELRSFDSKKLSIKIKKVNKITLLSGPYTTINLMKNDYIQLKNFGFEELDISINE
ncbi:hypothetical protein OAS21_02710 [Pelagibacteraceae bacterium]|nr:hypothetical protein [Pelagibacteraceae bacterium]